MNAARTRVGISVIALITALIAILSFSLTGKPTHRAAVASPSTVPGLSADDLTAITASGTTIDLLSSPGLSVVPEDSAIDYARDSFGFLSASNTAASGLARITVGTYGDELDSNPSHVAPLIHNRVVWIVVFSHFTMPHFGASDEMPSEQGSSRMWVAVDAITGEVLGGESS